MAPDGAAQWRRMLEGWEVVAADVWGTVLGRRNGIRLRLALATTTAASTPPPTPAEETATDYLTALAARDYVTAATLLDNDGQSPENRADLARSATCSPTAPASRTLYATGARTTMVAAACWMPRRIVDTRRCHSRHPTRRHHRDGYYDDRDVGAQARFVVDTWEGQPTIFGLPPLTDLFATNST